MKVRNLIAGFLLICSLPALAGTEEMTLSNGLKVVVRPDHRSPVVVTQVWYHVGSVDEHRGITGVSHALEHMMFKGTEKFPDDTFSALISKHGGRNNAFTADDFTAYYEEITADKLALSFELEADRMRGLLLKPEDFAKEIEVVKEERRLRTEDKPQGLLTERFLAAAYVAGGYRNPTIGWMEDLNQMTVSDLKAWYDQWYAPNNATLVVVGDVSAKQVFDLAQTYFGDIPAVKLPEVKVLKDVKPLGERLVSVSVPATLPSLLMGYNVPVLNTAKEDWEPYAIALLAAVLDGSKGARFEKHLIRKQQIASSTWVYYNPMARHNTLLRFGLTPAKDFSLDALKAAALLEFNALKKNLVDEGELQRAKTQLIASKIYEKDAISSQAIEIGSLESNGHSWAVGKHLPDRIKAVTAEQIQIVAQKYLNPQYLTVGMLNPQDASTEQKGTS